MSKLSHKKEYLKLEQHVIELFEREKFFTFNNTKYSIQKVGKPRPASGGGECKTDVYVLGYNSEKSKYKTLKLSIKRKTNNEFQGNKFTPLGAESLLGKDWEKIVSRATTSIAQKFEDSILIYNSSKGRTKANAITMGWKMEVTTKPRNLSVKLPLTDQEIKNKVYKGTDLPDRLSNAVLEKSGERIEKSGEAEYILYSEIDLLKNVSDVIEQMTLIDNMVIVDTYLAFTANNWYYLTDKTDGKRYLAVVVKWTLEKGKLVPHFIYNQPLNHTGHSNKEHLKTLIKKLGLSVPFTLTPKNVNRKYIHK